MGFSKCCIALVVAIVAPQLALAQTAAPVVKVGLMVRSSDGKRVGAVDLTLKEVRDLK